MKDINGTMQLSYDGANRLETAIGQDSFGTTQVRT
ncbi:bifunctional N-acetylglucosamine-1-phosphate-uridyltransferase/glucosamine-1-phosphate-acetyltransferase GlmU-like protein [Siphonobacter sp. BAB-5404]|nr:bifunctional N-acetylglucosamine-1-phosphate-uridyltransferase/glucosamine-1-phosphate-acetyltransferase GlmU-like protein [Siphonobacter sp. SORGH_AS_0500]